MPRPVAHLANLDLNLLVALRELLRERSVTRAAERLGVTQPAASAALSRLRRHFGDELMVRDRGVHLASEAPLTRRRSAGRQGGYKPRSCRADNSFACQPDQANLTYRAGTIYRLPETV